MLEEPHHPRPLVAGLLFVCSKIGIPATILLMVINVIRNVATTSCDAPANELLPSLLSFATLCQTGFMLFVLVTARTA